MVLWNLDDISKNDFVLVTYKFLYYFGIKFDSSDLCDGGSISNISLSLVR